MKKVLSDADVTKLRRTMADVDKLRGQIRTLHDRNKSSKRAGAHYVVKTPSGGIPASVGDEPGSADCNIHIRDGDPKELRDTTRAETVYNFGPAIPGDTILIAHRDAWGDLWAAESSVGGACEELDLQPGSYRGIAGATTAPGETGPVIITGCDGDVTIDAVNHSGCTFYLGDLITVNVDPCCVAHFTGCSCCDDDCCARAVQVCVCSSQQILKLGSGSGTFDASDCIDCEGATVEITMVCEGGVISANWVITCGEESDSGTLAGLDALCDAEETSIKTYINSTLGFIAVEFSNVLAECSANGPPECFCNNCMKNGILFTITGLSGNAPFTCDCGDFDGDYLLRYPEDVTAETCTQIDLSRTVQLGSCGGEDFTLTLIGQLRCIGSPVTTLSWQTSAAFASPAFQSIMPLATTNIPIADVVCPLSRTFNNTSMPAGSQRCTVNGVTVVARTV